MISVAGSAVTAVHVLGCVRFVVAGTISSRNLMFGSKHQIAQKEGAPCTISRLCADFISDLKFGSEHQIQSASAPFLSNVPTDWSHHARALFDSSGP
jgi:hypothetical protein